MTTSTCLRFDLTKLKQNLKLTRNSINNFFLSCLLLFPTTVRFLLMVLNAVKKLLQQRLHMTTLEVRHCVGSLTIALFILLNCMPFILPLGSSASVRKSPFWCCLMSVLKSISNCQCDNPLLVDLFNSYFNLICDNKDIVLAWVPRHVGIWGNSVVDLAAKHAPKKPIN